MDNSSLEMTEYVKGIGKETCCALVHTLPEWGLGASRLLPYKGLMGACGQSRYGLRDFRLKQGIDFFYFVLNMVSFMANVLNMVSFMANVLNMVWFWIKCLKQGINFCLKQGQGLRGRAAPSHPRIYRVPPSRGWRVGEK